MTTIKRVHGHAPTTGRGKARERAVIESFVIDAVGHPPVVYLTVITIRSDMTGGLCGVCV